MNGNLLDVSIEAKVRFLERGDAYAEPTERVERVETHFAHVFLTNGFAYKLKKPIRFHALDFSTLESRRRSCEAELELNRRLAAGVYLGIVPLKLASGTLALGVDAHGEVVDWLVRMRRLPRERMLDARLAGGDVGDDELRALVAKLATFYASAARAPWTGADYRRRLERELRQAAADLAARADGLGGSLVSRIASRQARLAGRLAAALEQRCAAGRVVDAHGDLRPEHVLLGNDPQIIDCVEFSAELRWLDTAEEIAFLALECAAAADPGVGERIVSLYEALCRDPVPRAVLELYSSRRALLRARSCAWHLDEPLAEARRTAWIRRTRAYLAAAEAALDRAG